MARQLTVTDDPLLRPLWEAVHARLCRGDLAERSVVTVPGADPNVRRAVDRLVGRVSTAGRVAVRIDTLNEALRRAGTTAQDAAVAVCGPVVDRAAARAAVAEARMAAWSRILSHPAAAEQVIAAWLDQVRAQGRLERAGGLPAFLAALDVLQVLPVNGEPVGRPLLAAAIVGDEHSLDDNTDIERLVTAGLAARAQVERPTGAAGRASLWAGAGVVFDSVSAPALTLGLRPVTTGPLTEAAGRWADGGVPLPIPAAALAAERWHVPTGEIVFVCENPSVLEAAASKLGAGCPPLVCVSGIPGRAVTTLLAQLAAGGAAIRYHGDFGAGGIVIANLVIARHGARPWRMSTTDHRQAVDRLLKIGRHPAQLRGRVPQASWDAELAESIETCGFEVTEEHVIDDLLADLTT